MSPLLHLLAGLAIAPHAAPAVTADEAIARQQAQVREAISYKCRAGTEVDEIVVCGERSNDGARYAAPAQPRGANFENSSSASLFEFKTGGLTIGCCNIKTSGGSGAGLSLNIRF